MSRGFYKLNKYIRKKINIINIEKSCKTTIDSVFVCVIESGCVLFLVVIVTEDGGVEQGDLPHVPVIVHTSIVEELSFRRKTLWELSRRTPTKYHLKNNIY